jgi:hypothetical protein
VVPKFGHSFMVRNCPATLNGQTNGFAAGLNATSRTAG